MNLIVPVLSRAIFPGGPKNFSHPKASIHSVLMAIPKMGLCAVGTVVVQATSPRWNVRLLFYGESRRDPRTFAHPHIASLSQKAIPRRSQVPLLAALCKRIKAMRD